MPYGDRTGPRGRGSRTGRGAGYCTGNDMPGYMKPGPGLGRGRGMGMGRGCGYGRDRGFGRGRWLRRDGIYPPEPYYDPYYGPAPYAKPDPEVERTYLEDLVKSLEEELGAVKDRLKELEKEKKDK